MMRISVIIPTKNEEENLPLLLEDIERQQLQPIEVFVADADSTDNTRAVAQQHNATVVGGGRPGIGRNRGAQAAHGELLYMFDADTRIPDPHFFERTAAEFRKLGLSVAVVDNMPNWLGTESTAQKSTLDVMFNRANWYMRRMATSEYPCGVGTCMIFDAAAFSGIGGFHPQAHWGEDTQIIRDLVKAGKRFAVLESGYILTSTRRMLDKGIPRFYLNVYRLNEALKEHGIVTEEIYRAVTGEHDYFSFARTKQKVKQLIR